MVISELFLEEKRRWRTRKVLIRGGLGGIVGVVPRGLRNSKPTET
jgi:hypothetical protein